MSNSSLTEEQRTIYEKTSGIISFTLTDETGVTPIPAASLTSLTLSVFDVVTNGIINSRDAVNALNANNVTVSSGGVVAYTMQPADNAIVGTVAPGLTESHAVLFRWTWSSGTKAGEHQLLLNVVSRAHVS